MENNGINYSNPNVWLLQDTGIGTAEVAGRTCYDSFSKSENASVYDFGTEWLEEVEQDEFEDQLQSLNNIPKSQLLNDLAWTHFHHSILEHSNLTFLIKGTSRGVLQEHARHRIQAISVRSTRYTMSSIINAYISAYLTEDMNWFINTILEFDMFVTSDADYNKLQIEDMGNKLTYQLMKLGADEFLNISLSKSNLNYVQLSSNKSADEIYYNLQNGPKKRNVGDAFKHLVNDNWKVDLVCTFNLRSLKNYFDLRDSGAAYFQIRELAKEMKSKTPIKYMRLIDKKLKDK